MKLINVSITGWTTRAASDKAISIIFKNVFYVLELIKSLPNFDTKTRSSSTALYKKTLNFDFIASLYFDKNIISKINTLIELLETQKLNNIDVMQSIESTIKNFNEINDEKKLDDLIGNAVAFAKTCNDNTEVDFIKHHRVRLIPKRIDNHPKTVANIDFFQFYRKKFRIVLNSFTTAMHKHVETIIKFNVKISYIKKKKKN